MATTSTRVEFELFGDYAGKTKTIGGIDFRNGLGSAVLSAENVTHLKRYMTYYNGFMRGTPEHAEAAKARDEADGISSESPTNPPTGKIEGLSGVHGAGVKGPADKRSAARSGSNGAKDAPQLVPNGDGHEHSGVVSGQTPEPSFQDKMKNDKIVRICAELDPENDDHWTEEGQPALEVVEQAFGRAGLTRRDIEQAMPDFTREVAFEAKLA
jgi:hypothetical protein